MDRMTDEPDVVIEEYEEVVGNLDELSDRVESEDAEAESIQEPTSVATRILTTHTGRPSLRSTNARLAGRQEESKPVVVTYVVIIMYFYFRVRRFWNKLIWFDLIWSCYQEHQLFQCDLSAGVDDVGAAMIWLKE